MNEKIKLGLIMSPGHYILGGFASAWIDLYVRGLVNRFECRLIAKQSDFDEHYDDVDALFSFDPGLAAPVLDWRRDVLRLGRRTLAKFNLRIPIGKRKPKLSYVSCGDPFKRKWRQDYMLENEIAFMLALFDAPVRRHFTKIPSNRFVLFPFLVPDEWITDEPIVCRHQDKVCCFGAGGCDAYNVRNWCKEFDFVMSSPYSGVENKVLHGRAYFEWLKGFDAMVAAGSDLPKYDQTNPKYFEIAASGALLFAQKTSDLDLLGFRDMENCVIFEKSNFVDKAMEYLSHPEDYVPIREAGRRFIRDKHSLSVRLDFLEGHMRQHLA